MKRDSLFQPLVILRRGFSFLLILSIGFVAGCGPSSPRFTEKETKDHKEEKHRKGSIRFSSKESEEEIKEDDKKIDVKKAGERFSSKGAPAKKTGIRKNEPPSKENAAAAKPEVPAVTGTFEHQKMMDLILEWMGTPYEYGAESRSGTDCSGFTLQMFSQSAGIKLPRSTEEQVKMGTPVGKENLKFGDLVFFNTTGQNPSHVGIYIGDDMFAHASVSFGVTLSSMYSSYYKKRYTEARRIIQ
ncbi:MAG: NlpC/P60 family protein [Bacteroidota bacterium]|jgi:cell wall-associated NlpC family hydrolase